MKQRKWGAYLGQVGNDETATKAECEQVCEPVVFLLGVSWDRFGSVVDSRCCRSTLLGWRPSTTMKR